MHAKREEELFQILKAEIKELNNRIESLEQHLVLKDNQIKYLQGKIDGLREGHELAKKYHGIKD